MLTACGDGGRERGTVGTVQSAAEDSGEFQYTALAGAQGTERGDRQVQGQAARGNASPAASHPTSPILGFQIHKLDAPLVPHVRRHIKGLSNYAKRLSAKVPARIRHDSRRLGCQCIYDNKSSSVPSRP